MTAPTTTLSNVTPMTAAAPPHAPLYNAAGKVLGMVTDPPRGTAVPGATIRSFLRSVAPANLP
jgi:hypothetical protein